MSEIEETDLPVLKAEDAASGVNVEKSIRTEIPDSEADTEEAISPMRGPAGAVENRASDENMDVAEQDGEKKGLPASMASAGGMEDEALKDGNQEELEDEKTGERQTPGLQPVTGDEISPHVENDPANRSSNLSSNVDIDSMIIFPELTTSDLQPTHTQVLTQTQTQTQIQEEVIDSHFADALAVMSNVGNGTQDIMSSIEAGIQGANNDMNSSGDIGSRQASQIANVADQKDDITTGDEVLDSTPGEGLSSDKIMDLNDVAAVSPDVALLVPESDEDEEIPDTGPPSKETKDERISHSMIPTDSQSTPFAPNTGNENDTTAANTSSPAETKQVSKIQPLQETPNISFNIPPHSKTPESESPSKQTTSLPLKSEATAPTPAKPKSEKSKSPMAMKSFKASDVSQNKDVLMAELKAIKIASIQARNASLEEEIRKKKAKLDEVTRELKHPAAETVKLHIKLLHDYNDIRDVGQGLVGMIADNRGVRIGELYEEFGVGLRD
ncbi:uncharacterized protein RSE6_10615 [Rhynchosporium secalis]|uniref:Uncharacterized protein n=1 Tax=Rhynchosporium secalis TaxID=38038 RepID=A0A1E1MKX0_RHYSE|nr:uncharacterized protein RSE6_10615 [Rhynchosporium secalis]